MIFEGSVEATSLIGRDADVESLLALLAANGSRMVTVAGIGGIGKTRVAARAVQRASERFASVYAIELAPVSDARVVIPMLADMLEMGGRPTTLEGVAEAIGAQHNLLVLDNCEHVLEPVAAFSGALIARCPNLRILTTSRVLFGLAEETRYVLAPLSVVAHDPGETSAAATLFTERARQALPDFDADVWRGEVEDIVRGLDGLPLAIELAAARVRAISPREIAAGLDNHMALLASGPRNAAARHRTMRASLDLSASLLSRDQRQLVTELSIFADGFTLEASRATCRNASLDAISVLIDHSLLSVDRTGPDTWYRFPESVRQYATELLCDDEVTGLKERYCAYYVGFMRKASEEHWAFSRVGRQRLERDSANLRQAMEYAGERGTEEGLWLTAWLEPFWRERARPAEGAMFAQKALESGPTGESPARALGLAVLSMLQLNVGLIEQGIKNSQDALAMAERTGDAQALAVAINKAGALRSLVDPVGARELLARGLAFAQEVDDLLTQSDILAILMSNAYYQGDREAIERLAGPALGMAETVGSTANRRWAMYVPPIAALWNADGAQARQLVERALDIGEGDDGDDEYSRAVIQSVAALVEAHTGEAAAGRDRANSWLNHAATGTPHMGIGSLTYALAVCALASDDLDGAHEHAKRASQFPAVVFPLVSTEVLMRVAIARREPEAVELHAEALAEIARRVEDRRSEALAMAGYADAAALRGDLTRAARLAEAALQDLSSQKMTLGVIDVLEELGAIYTRLGDHEKAVRVLGAVETARASSGVIRTPPDAERWASVTDLACEGLGGSYPRVREEGLDLGLAEAVEYVLRGRGPRGRPTEGWGSLTPVEQRVAGLVAEGLTNPQVGERLFISRSTVKMHLTHIYLKLGVSGRTGLAAHIGEARQRAGELGSRGDLKLRENPIKMRSDGSA